MMVILQPRNSSKLRQNVLHLQSSPTIIFSLLAILSPINGVLAGINWLLIFRRSRLKQCSYRISKADPPSTYMRCIQWPPFSASIIIRPSIPSSSPRGGKEISGLGEKLYEILCLATLSQGWTIRIANTLSFPTVSPFFVTLGCSFSLFCFSSLIRCDSFPALSISSICFRKCMHSSVLCPTSP
ncbi:hypothetical protein Tco_0765209 [Tanacetum coccineum]